MDHGEEVAAEFFEAGGQSAHVLHGTEEALDDIAHPVEGGVMGDGPFGVALGGNDRQCAFIDDELAVGARAVGFVGNDGERLSGAMEKGRQDLAIVNLASRDDKAPGKAVFIDYRVNLTCAAAA